MKALIIGSGFISRYLTHCLVKNKIEVIINHHNDTHDYKVDYIFYLAAHGNHYQQRDDIKSTFKANVADFFDVLTSTQNIDYKALIYVSTSSVHLPTQTMYSGTKHATEKIIQGYVHQNNKPVISVRPFSVYGEYEADFRFIPTVIKSIVKYETFKLVPKARHDWIYASDLVEGMFLCAKNADKLKGHAIDIGTSYDTSNLNIVKMIETIMNKPAKYEIINQMRTYDNDLWMANPEPLETMGWSPKVSLSDGLRKTIEYYQAMYQN